MHEVDTEYFHQTMNVNLDANFCKSTSNKFALSED